MQLHGGQALGGGGNVAVYVCNIAQTKEPLSHGMYSLSTALLMQAATVSSGSSWISLLHEAQNKCPFMNVEAISERYCALTRAPQDVWAPSKQLICSIPAVLVDNKVRVQQRSSHHRWSGRLRTDLWTQVYAPRQTGHVIGNSEACHTLVEWLKCWTGSKREGSKPDANINLTKRRQLFVKQQQQCVNQPSTNSQTYYSSGEEKEEEETFPVAAVLHGPHGCGKTAAVYACAEELGLEVSA